MHWQGVGFIGLSLPVSPQAAAPVDLGSLLSYQVAADPNTVETTKYSIFQSNTFTDTGLCIPVYYTRRKGVVLI